MSQRALFLINPNSRRGTAAREQARDCLQKLGLILVEESPVDPADFPEIIRRYRDQVDLIIVGGGDGTVNAAIQGLLETRLPLGVLPLGTANNLARTLGIPPNLPAACETIAQGHQQPIDLGWVNGRYFLNVAGIGLSTNVNQQVAKRLKRHWGVIAYALTAFRLMLQQRRLRAEIHWQDQAVRVKTYQITICNGRHYGSGLTVAADADIDDQRLDLCSLEFPYWWHAILLLPAMMRGEYPIGRGIRTLHSDEIQIVTAKPYPIDTDGEVTTHTPATFRVIPRAITVFAPVDKP